MCEFVTNTVFLAPLCSFLSPLIPMKAEHTDVSVDSKAVPVCAIKALFCFSKSQVFNFNVHVCIYF